MTAGTQPALVLDEVDVAFGDTTVLHEISLSVPAGTTAAIIGPSGSGKSTLLRAVAGLEPLVAGRVSIDGRDQAGIAPDKRRLGLMFQDHALFPHLDVAANVAFGLRMAGADRSASAARVAEVLEMVGLAAFGSRDVQTLSGGEAQRVALARSLAPAPRLLMLDEPFGSLDRSLRAGLVTELRRLFAELGVTVLHVTHDQQEAFDLAHEVFVLRDGRLVQHGTPAALWHRPADTFVAEFLGHPNIWADGRGTVVAPIPALCRIDLGQSVLPSEMLIDAIVVDAAFREGRWRLTADEVGGPGRRLVLDSDEPANVSDRIRVLVDTGRLHSLL